jgi:LytS/YehU family sensor histidine kinase
MVYIILFINLIFNVVFYIKKQRAVNEKLKCQISQSELKLLRSKMNTHFLFNSINSIKSHIVKQENQAAINHLTAFAGFMRIILNHTSKKSIPLSEELKALQYYLFLEKMRMKDKLDFRIDMTRGIDCQKISISPLLLQTLIEEILWNKSPGVERNFIHIQIHKINDKLHINIEKLVSFTKGFQNKSQGTEDNTHTKNIIQDTETEIISKINGRGNKQITVIITK